MARYLLHLLLALTLALNGISAPWAMARMSSHDTHSGHEAPNDPTAGLQGSSAEHAHHAAHNGHGYHGDSGLASKDANPAPATEEGSCCEGTACQCGCVLPPVVPLIALTLPSNRPSTLPFVFPPQHAVMRRGSPPFRPPAV